MPSRAKLGPEELAAALRTLPQWRQVPGREAITRTFKFTDFSRAFAFMARVALLAEKLDHHPEWSNVYGTVTVILATHDAGGVSEHDVRMARAMDEFVA